MQQIYKNASQYNNTLMSSAYTGIYSGEPVRIYDSAFKVYTDAGKNGQHFDQIYKNDSVYKSVIDRATLWNMYAVGVNYGKEISRVTVSKEQQNTVNALAKALNVNVKFVDNIENGSANGKYENGTIYIAKDSQNYAMAVFTHELTHMLKQNSEKGYTEYERTVIDYFREYHTEDYQNRLDKLKKLYGEESEDFINEEMVCNATEAMLTDVDFIEEIVRTKPSLAERILETIRNILSKIKSLYKDYKPSSEEGKMLAADIETLRKAEKLWVEAINSMNKENVINDNSRFQSKVLGGYIPDINIDSDKILQKYGITNLNNKYDVIKKVKKSIRYLTTPEQSKPIKNIDTGRVVFITSSGIRETFGNDKYYANQPNDVKKAKIASMDYLANIIKYGEIRNKSAPNYHDKNSNAIFHYLKSKITVDGILYNVTVDLKEIDRTIFYIHGLNINKNAVHRGQNLSSNSALTGAQHHTKSIEQKTNNVNSNSNQFLKYIPDKLLSEEQIESKKMLYWKLMIR